MTLPMRPGDVATVLEQGGVANPHPHLNAEAEAAHQPAVDYRERSTGERTPTTPTHAHADYAERSTARSVQQ